MTQIEYSIAQPALDVIAERYQNESILVSNQSSIGFDVRMAQSQTAQGSVRSSPGLLLITIDEPGRATSMASYLASVTNQSAPDAHFIRWSPIVRGTPCVGPLLDETNTTGRSAGGAGTGTI